MMTAPTKRQPYLRAFRAHTILIRIVEDVLRTGWRPNCAKRCCGRIAIEVGGCQGLELREAVWRELEVEVELRIGRRITQPRLTAVYIGNCSRHWNT